MKPFFSLQVAKIVGTPSDEFWAQVHSFFPEEREKKIKRGDLLAVLVIGGLPLGVEAVAAGREILGQLHQEYYEKLEGSAFERLKTAVERLSETEKNLELIVAVLLDQVLYLAILGQGKVFLKRGEKLGLLLRGNETLQLASGIIKEGDLLVLGSEQFFSAVSDGVLRASLQNGFLEEAVETLTPLVLGRQDIAAAAAILACVREKVALEPVMEEEKSFSDTPFLPPKKKWWEKFNFNLAFLKKRHPIFVRSSATERRKKFYFLVSLILLAFLGISLIFGLQRKNNEEKLARTKELLRQAEEKLNQGKTLSAIQPTEGKVLGEEAKKITQQALSLNAKNEEALFLKQEVEKFLNSLGQEVILQEPIVFMDLHIIADDASGKALGLNEKNLVILDDGGEKVYSLSLENKSSLIINSGSPADLITTENQKTFVLTKKGIFSLDWLQKSAVLKIEADEAWQEVIGLVTYAGNLYLLDRKANNLWRYKASGEGFGEKKSWFVGSPPDLSLSRAMVIDGSIWILTKDKIKKFSLGKEEDFSLSGMPEDFLDPVKIYTSAETKNLYVLDKGRGKIYEIAKSGEFKAAYSWEGFKNAQDLVAVEAAKKLFVLSGSKIYAVDLR